MKQYFHGHGSAEPISLEYLAASLAQAGYTYAYLSNNEFEVSKAGSHKTISLLTGHTSEWPTVLKLAENAKARNSITIVGGYHVSAKFNEIEDNCIDFLVVGEGEFAVVDIARRVIDGSQNIYEPCDKPTITKAPVILDLDSIPSPVRDFEFLNRYKLYDLMWPSPSRQENVAIVLASRGCRYDCDFCASVSVWGKGVRLRSPDKVVEELMDLKTRFGTNTIVFIDQSFGQDTDWTINLCNSIKQAELGISWYHQSNLDIHRDVLEAMAQAGCTKIGFGLEGITEKAVERIKNQNISDFATINSIFDYCNALGMLVKAYLIIGYPWETELDILEFKENIQKIRANEIKISFFTPFPGTRDWDKYNDSLITHEWENFDTVQMPVVFNPHITVGRYHEVRQELFHAFYGSEAYNDVTGKMLRLKPEYEQSARL